ncbi:MAG: CHAT domain-containing protein, partial [Alphaproteobacteria bacterium]|nr:CHAT domain-containing protein [Alphaproteobacteria bacterium]
MLRMLLAGIVVAAALCVPPAQAQNREGIGRGQGQQGGQRQAFEQALAVFEKGNFVEAEKLFRRLLEDREQGRVMRGPPLPAILSRLGYSIAEQGRYAEAEPIMRRSLLLSEQEGADPRSVGGALTVLGNNLRMQGRVTEAEPLMRRAVAVRERHQPGTTDLAVTLSHFSLVLRHLKRFEEAESVLRRALAIREEKLGPDHPHVGMNLVGLSMVLREQGRLDEAAALAERAIKIQEDKLGQRHPRTAQALVGHGLAKLAQGDHAGAEALLRRAAVMREESLGPQHPDTALAYANHARALALLNRPEDALVAIRRATEIARARRDNDEQRYDEGAETERRSARSLFAAHAGLAHLASLRAAPAQKDELMSEAYEMAQWAQTGGVAGALARMSARFASGTGPLAQVVREREDALARRQFLDRSLLELLSKPPQERIAAEEAAMRDEIVELGRRLASLDKTLAKEFPGYAELAAARPLKLSQTKQLLGPDEALLLYLVRDQGAFLWVVRRERTLWLHLKTPRASLEQAVKALRATLNPAENRDFRPMPLEQAHLLYRDLVAPGEGALAGVRHLLVVPDGPLQSLPFGLLTTSAPKGKGTDPDYRGADWLTRKYAISVLPSASSLQALRATAAASAKREPFAGFGDPALAGRGEATPGPSRGGPAIVMRGFVVDSGALQQLEPLPESGRELAELARYMRASPEHVWTGKEATETRVKSTDLSRFRVLAFATHGLMAGEIVDFAEPSLVLTPPAAGTPDDDGLLTASEVAQLKLDADWVILSACNTAAPDATPGAEGLSGLAKAFFYAGARSLLVSNWYVASDAAVKLTTGAVAALDREPGIG